MLNAFCDHCHTKALSFDTGMNASMGYKEEQHVAFRTEADTIAQPWMWVLSKHDFRSRKLFEGQTTKELTAKNLWARKMWKVILSCLFHNKTLSVTYPANSSEFTAENAGGYLLPLHRGSKSCMNALHDADEWHTCKRPGNPQRERSSRKYSASLAKDTHSSLSSFVTIHLPWRNKMSRK